MSGPEQIVLVVGGSRGLGLGFVKQLAQTPATRAIGTLRKPAPNLEKELPHAKFLLMDMTDDASVVAAAAQVPELDVLVINGAFGARDPVTSTSTATLQTYLETNVLGPHRVINAFLPALRARKTRKIVVIASSSASLAFQAEPTSGGLAGSYGVSKAALNMLVVQIAKELNRPPANEAFTVVPIHPGWVATDMGNQHGPGGQDPQEAAKKILELVDKLESKDSATFYKFDGTTMPW
uniref:NAD(P)-binding protein n=1 Tax=Mycena chlorophos TaxID=658473 RepID=A0ABQ0LQU6_MYCCL|nr:predicted protein [Mycena chlorophos]